MKKTEFYSMPQVEVINLMTETVFASSMEVEQESDDLQDFEEEAW